MKNLNFSDLEKYIFNDITLYNEGQNIKFSMNELNSPQVGDIILKDKVLYKCVAHNDITSHEESDNGLSLCQIELEKI